MIGDLDSRNRGRGEITHWPEIYFNAACDTTESRDQSKVSHPMQIQIEWTEWWPTNRLISILTWLAGLTWLDFAWLGLGWLTADAFNTKGLQVRAGGGAHDAWRAAVEGAHRPPMHASAMDCPLSNIYASKKSFKSYIIFFSPVFANPWHMYN